MFFDVVLPPMEFDQNQKRQLTVCFDGDIEVIDLAPGTALVEGMEGEPGEPLRLKLRDFGSNNEIVDLVDANGMVHRNRRVPRSAEAEHEYAVVLSPDIPWCPAGRLGIRVKPPGESPLAAAFQDLDTVKKLSRGDMGPLE